MDTTRFERLASTVERMLGPTGHDEASSEAHGHLARANEPRRGWWKHHEPGDPQTLFPQGGRVEDLRLNMKVGQGTDTHAHIRGLAAMTFTALEQETREVVARLQRHRARNVLAMITVAAEILGLGPQAARMLLTGPNWFGEAAAWVSPDEAARARRTAAAERDVNRCWRHIDRGRLHRLHAGEDAAEYLYPWAKEMVDDTLAAIDPAMHEARVHDEVRELLRIFPSGRISPVRASTRARRSGTGSVGAESRIGNGSRVSGPVGERTRIGHGCDIEGPVGSDTTTGDSVKSRVAIGNDCSIGSRSEIGRPTDGDTPHERVLPRLADGSTIGCEVRITENWRGKVRLRMGHRSAVANVTSFPTRMTVDNERRMGTLDELAGKLATEGNEPQIEPGVEWGSAEPPARGVHARCDVAVLPGASVGEGTTLEPRSVVGADAEVGRFVLVDRDSTVRGKAIVGDATRVGPGRGYGRAPRSARTRRSNGTPTSADRSATASK